MCSGFSNVSGFAARSHILGWFNLSFTTDLHNPASHPAAGSYVPCHCAEMSHPRR